jgi:chromosome partitioning protein
MHFFSSVDWGFLEAFFGEYGKLVTTVLATVAALMTLAVALFKYLHARILEKERDDARRDVEKSKAALQHEKKRVREHQLALKEKEADLESQKRALRVAAVKLTEQEREIKSREEKLQKVRDAFSGKEHDLWCIHPAAKPSNYDHKIWVQRHKPIVTVANLKGGVGKTTLTANLAAFFGQAGMRVLLIDMDYQGSLSNMLLSADRVVEVSAEVSKLLEPGSDATTFMNCVQRFENILAGSAIVSSRYEFASCENRLMIEYLLHEALNDGRYRLAKVLLDERVSTTFDIALIDAPPRLTAGTINAFCASTHLLIPTVYDNLSAEAVGTFLGGVQVLKTRLNPGIDLLGVVGTLTYQQGGLNDREQQARNVAIAEVQKTWGANHYFFKRHIPRKEAIADAAGQSLAYFKNGTVKEWFDELGQEILERLSLPLAGPPDSRPRPNGHAFRQMEALQQPGAGA